MVRWKVRVLQGKMGEVGFRMIVVNKGKGRLCTVEGKASE